MPYELPPPRRGRWVARWCVESDDLDHEYTVSIDAAGEYGCSCPRWKFKREQCKHITLLQFWLARGDQSSGDGLNSSQPAATSAATAAATIPAATLAATYRLIDLADLSGDDFAS